MVLEVCKWVYMAIAFYFIIKTSKDDSQLQKSVYLAITMLAVVLATLVQVLQRL